jgi:hypothetical protein
MVSPIVGIKITVFLHNGQIQTFNATEVLNESKFQLLSHVPHIPVPNACLGKKLRAALELNSYSSRQIFDIHLIFKNTKTSKTLHVRTYSTVPPQKKRVVGNFQE